MENLGFALVLVLVSFWIASWSILSAIMAGFRKVPPSVGTVLGATLGPLGIVAVFLLPRSGDSYRFSDSAPRSGSDTPVPTYLPTASGSDDVDPFA
jgi:hypothetical protein